MTTATRKTKAQDQADSIAHLRRTLKQGDTLYHILRHVAPSGMSRTFDVYAFPQGAERPIYLTGWVAAALRLTRTDNGLRVNGVGFDAGYQVAYDLGYALWPEYYDRTNGTRAEGQPISALRSEWL